MDTNTLSDILQVVLPFLYAGVVTLYALSFFRGLRSADRAATPALIALASIHAWYLVVRTLAFDHPPITSVFEIMSMLAFFIAASYLYIQTQTKARATGFLILSLALLFQTISSVFIRDMIEIPAFLHSMVLGLHVAAALLGYTGISLSAAYGFLYLMLYHDIKSSRFGVVYERLPNLETLETMSHRAEMFGFWALSVAIAIGLFWLPNVFSDFSYLDPKLIATMIIWALYAAGLAAKRQYGWQGRKMMIVSLVAFGFIFFSMTIINFYLSGFHSFH